MAIQCSQVGTREMLATVTCEKNVCVGSCHLKREFSLQVYEVKALKILVALKMYVYQTEMYV